MPEECTTIVWFRNDLRTDDHRPLAYGAARGHVLPLFIWDTESQSKSQSNLMNPQQLGGAPKWWLHHSLKSLAQTLESLGSPLIVRDGNPLEVLKKLCHELGADQVAIHDSLDPDTQVQDDSLDSELDLEGIELVRFDPDLLWQVGAVLTGSAKPYQVFTPFWKNAFQIDVEEPIEPPAAIKPPKLKVSHQSIDTLGLLDSVDWAAGFDERWTPGERASNESLHRFITNGLDEYHLTRDQLAAKGSSELSAPLHFGELSVRRMWHTLRSLPQWDQSEGVAAYRRQLGWRDFANHLMNHFPHTVSDPFREQFARFPWVSNDDHLIKWQRGMTGYPVVDAAMRNLWAEGWMPNRARMIVASFLCKDLLISWEHGANWFWDTLVDANLANNNFGWQWTAGCGADAAPFFRIFNPITQGKKFDPKGDYVRKWVPELASLSNSQLHSPWEVSPLELQSAGITLGEDYPFPIVDHAKARSSALAAYEKTK